MLKDLLETKNCFKLVCGAGNEDADEVEKLVIIYSLAGCQFFDVCAKPEIVDAAKKGLENAGIKDDRYICVSVGIDGDPHITKAIIDKNVCSYCGKCKSICPHEAINENLEIIEARCLGCGQCLKTCSTNAITMTSKTIDYKEVLPEIIKKGILIIDLYPLNH